MPQLITAAIIGGLVWFGYRAFRRHAQASLDEIRKRRHKDAPTRLTKGDDGVYRPDQDRQD